MDMFDGHDGRSGMVWKVAQAKQRLSEVLRSAAEEPQTICSRSRPVAVVVAGKTFEEFKTWQAERNTRSVGSAFAELRSLAAGSRYVLATPRRRDRRNAFARTPR
jgi:prevent-host-death family protein